MTSPVVPASGTSQNGKWFLGRNSVAKIRRLARCFHELLIEETSTELHASISEYVPWLAVRSRRVDLSPLFDSALLPRSRGLLVDKNILAKLAAELRIHDKHPLARIVPYDIGARIYEIDAAQTRYWKQQVKKGQQLLFESIPWMSHIYRELIYCVVPIQHRVHGKPKKRGFSTPLAHGAIFLSFEDRDVTQGYSRVEMAIDLAHELGHHVLHLYQTADPLISSSLTSKVYSGVRKSLRPAIMSLHASAALAFMIEACRGIQANRSATAIEQKFAKGRQQLFIKDQADALSALARAAQFTALGTRIMTECERQIQGGNRLRRA